MAKKDKKFEVSDDAIRVIAWLTHALVSGEVIITKCGKHTVLGVLPPDEVAEKVDAKLPPNMKAMRPLAVVIATEKDAKRLFPEEENIGLSSDEVAELKAADEAELEKAKADFAAGVAELPEEDREFAEAMGRAIFGSTDGTEGGGTGS